MILLTNIVRCNRSTGVENPTWGACAFNHHLRVPSLVARFYLTIRNQGDVLILIMNQIMLCNMNKCSYNLVYAPPMVKSVILVE